MKKILFILIALLLTSAGTIWGNEESENKNVIINRGSSNDSDKKNPRDLLQVPITCMYQDGFLFFTFLEDLGEVEIAVTNQSIGENFIYGYNSAYGSVVMNVSSDNGNYLIEIVTEDGEYYYGQYIL